MIRRPPNPPPFPYTPLFRSEPTPVRRGDQLSAPPPRAHRGCLGVRPETPAEAHLRRGDCQTSVTQVMTCGDGAVLDGRLKMIDGRLQGKGVDARDDAASGFPKTEIFRSAQFGVGRPDENDRISRLLEVRGHAVA